MELELAVGRRMDEQSSMRPKDLQSSLRLIFADAFFSSLVRSTQMSDNLRM